MSIDTEMPGSPDAVFAVADWLGKVSTEMNTGAREVRRQESASWGALDGPAGRAYRDFLGDLNKATEEVEDRADRAEEVVRSYGLQLKWRQEDMADHRKSAREGGLTVTGFVISKPPDAVSPGELPDDPSPEQTATWKEENAAFKSARKKVELYNDLLKDVRGTFNRLDTWVSDNLVSMEAEISASFSVAAMFGALVGLGFTIPENKFTARAHDLKQSAIRYAEELARRRSGNPAVRAGSKPPRQASIDKASKPGTRAGNLLGQSDEALKWAKRIGRANLLTGLAIGGWEIYNGESPSKVAIETGTSMLVGAGVAAGAAALAAAGVVTAPVWVTGLVVVGVGTAAAVGAGWAYEKFVPQDVREKIDEGIKDTWDGIKDGVGGAWNAVFG